MTRDETKEMLMMIEAAYPNYHPQNKTAAINTWDLMLKEYDGRIVSMALRAYMANDESGFAPSIGQIIGYIHRIAEPEQLGEGEAWDMVMKAIRHASESQMEFDKLPPIVQKAVGSPQQIWSMGMDMNFNEGVARSNFIKAYRIELERAKEHSKTPADIRQLKQSGDIQRLIENTADKLTG